MIDALVWLFEPLHLAGVLVLIGSFFLVGVALTGKPRNGAKS